MAKRKKKKRKVIRRRRPVSLPKFTSRARLSAKPESQSTGFGKFFDNVVGKHPTDAQREQVVIAFRRITAKYMGKKRTSLRRIRKIWDRGASMWRELIPKKVKEREIELIKMHGRIAPSDNITSIGSAVAIQEAFIAKHFAPKGKMTCIDLSPEMNKIAEQIKKKAQVENMVILTRKGHKTRLPSSSQDKIILNNTNLIFTVHWRPLLREIRRIIKERPESRFIFSFLIKDPAKVGEQALKSIREAGFQEEVVAKYATTDSGTAIMVIAKPILNQ